jgi:hypothetical protein
MRITNIVAIGFGVGLLAACSVSTDDTASSGEDVNAYVACGGTLKAKNSTANACYDGVCAKSNGHDAGTLYSCGSTRRLRRARRRAAATSGSASSS